MLINAELLRKLLSMAADNPRRRQHMDLRTGDEVSTQRMLNALLPGTEVPIHRHPRSCENVIALCGKADMIIYDAEG